jgi:transposase, IS5 family
VHLLARTCRLRRALNELPVTIERAAAIVAQSRSRLAGTMPDSATPLVSVHDPDARPIRNGRIDRPVEFGYKAQVADNDDGIVLDCKVEYSAARDGPQLAPAVERIARRAGQVSRAATADRGYGRPAVEHDLRELGIRIVAIPRHAATSQARKAVGHGRPSGSWSSGGPAAKAGSASLNAATAWTAPSWTVGRSRDLVRTRVFARNLVKISALTA